jgi:hypothetical protein
VGKLREKPRRMVGSRRTHRHRRVNAVDAVIRGREGCVEEIVWRRLIRAIAQ